MGQFHDILHSIARNGDSIPIPDLWAAFLLIHPKAEEGDETATAQSINALFPMVVHTGLNYVGYFMGCNTTDPHPQACRVNDPFFFQGSTGTQYKGQQNLWNDSTSSLYTCDNFYNINIDSAWALETGKPFIKVGIYDSGLDGLHQDFSPDQNNLGHASRKAYGWNFIDNISLNQANWAGGENPNVSTPAGLPFSHGTEVAGIIGAIRNNGVGIAGIAGGNWSVNDTNNFGVTLYAMKIDSFNMNPGTPSNYMTLPLATLCNALIFGCTSTPDSSFGFGLHVINCSWGVAHDSIGYNNIHSGVAYNDMDLSELEGAFRDVYRNQTSIVAAAGNTSLDFIYPANFYNDWIICVGGANDTGSRYVYGGGGATTNYTASYAGPCVDIIAPSKGQNGAGSYQANTTSYSGDRPPYSGYTNSMEGTSMATPHATGTIALLMSYLNSGPYSISLSPEDAEQLLIRSAVDVDSPGYDINTGWGDLNAGRALQTVNKRCKAISHLKKPGNVTPSATLEKAYTPITLTEPYTNADGKTFDTLSWLCSVYKETAIMPQIIDSVYDITAYWTRPSSTNLLLAYDSTSHRLRPFEHLYIDSMSRTTAVVSGYFYKVYRVSDSSYAGLWGMDSTYLHGIDNSRFDYTVLFTSNTTSCYTVDTTTAIREIKNTSHVLFYPNPVTDAGELDIFTDQNTTANVDVLDMQGRILEEMHHGALNAGENKFILNTKTLASGIYTISIKLLDETKIIKFVKINP